LPEIRAVHQRHNTAEYAFLIQELPSLQRLHPGQDLTLVYADAIQAYKDARARSLRLYPGVQDTLARLKAAGCSVVGYTESQSFYSSFRIRTLGLDGVLDALFSPADHDGSADLRWSERPDAYELLRTRHEHTPPGEYKPNPEILSDILNKTGARKETTIYVGDSLMKDVAMAQDVGVCDVHAEYGQATHREVYDLLRLVTPWSDTDVDREKRINSRGSVTPTFVLRNSMTELFDLFEFDNGNG
jgi:phosphoglycolate phosphatase-like HAD superfamily hydrolase